MTKKPTHSDEEAEFKQFIHNIKSAIDEDLAHPENFEEDPEELESFKKLSEGLAQIDNLNRTELFQLGMEVGGLIHMMELSNEILDVLEHEDDDSLEDWDDEEMDEESGWEDLTEEEDVDFDDSEQPSKNDKRPGGSCGNCGCH